MIKQIKSNHYHSGNDGNIPYSRHWENDRFCRCQQNDCKIAYLFQRIKKMPAIPQKPDRVMRFIFPKRPKPIAPEIRSYSVKNGTIPMMGNRIPTCLRDSGEQCQYHHVKKISVEKIHEFSLRLHGAKIKNHQCDNKSHR